MSQAVLTLKLTINLIIVLYWRFACPTWFHKLMKITYAYAKNTSLFHTAWVWFRLGFEVSRNVVMIKTNEDKTID